MSYGLATVGTFVLYARLAQLGEHLPYKQRVGGSSPSLRTKETGVTVAQTAPTRLVRVRIFSLLPWSSTQVWLKRTVLKTVRRLITVRGFKSYLLRH